MMTQYKCATEEEMAELVQFAQRLGYNFRMALLTFDAGAHYLRILTGSQNIYQTMGIFHTSDEVPTLPEFHKALVEGRFKKGDWFEKGEYRGTFDRCEIAGQVCWVIDELGRTHGAFYIRPYIPTDEEMERLIKEWSKKNLGLQWADQHRGEGSDSFPDEMSKYIEPDGTFKGCHVTINPFTVTIDPEEAESLIPPPKPPRKPQNMPKKKYLSFDDFKTI